MIYGAVSRQNPALSGATASMPLPRGGAGMGEIGDLSSLPLPQLGQLAQQEQSPALKAAAMAEIGKRGSGADLNSLSPSLQTAMPEAPLAAVATGQKTMPGQLPPVTPATISADQTNPAMDAIATGVTAADATADRVPSYVDQGLSSPGSAVINVPALAASSPVNPALSVVQQATQPTIGGLASDPTEATSQDRWLALAKGFGTMAASKQPGLLGAIGEGAATSADAMMAANQNARANALSGAGINQNQQIVDIKVAQEAERKALAKQQLDAVNAAVKGLPPDLQAMALADPSAFFGAQFKAMFDKGHAPDAVQEYQYAVSPQGGGFKGTFQQWTTEKARAARASSDSGFFGTPIQGVDAQGNPAILVLGKDGQLHPTTPPAGTKVATPLQYLNTGPNFTPAPKYAGQGTNGAGPVAIDSATPASQKAQGEAQAAAVVALPGYAAKAGTILQQINDLKSAPGIDTATGLSSWLDPRNYVAGTDAYAFKQRVKQLSGGAFLQAYNDLRGGGAITEVEGQQAKDALVRMDTAQRKEDFLAALDDFQSVINKGLAVAQQKASAAPVLPGDAGRAAATPQPSIPPPPPGFKVTQ